MARELGTVILTRSNSIFDVTGEQVVYVQKPKVHKLDVNNNNNNNNF